MCKYHKFSYILANTAQAHSMYGQFHIKLVAQLDGLSIGILIYVLIIQIQSR